MQRKDAAATVSSRARRLGLAALMAFAATAASSSTAQAAIEVDHGIEFVNITDVPANTELLLTVEGPGGNTIGSKVFNTPTGAYEVNHIGAEEDDCFDGTSSPDIRPGDTLRVSDADGELDSYTVADVRYEARFDPAAPGTSPTMVVAGWARDSAGGAIAAPELRLQRGPFDAGAAVTGGSLDQNRGNRLLIGPDQAADGSFSLRVAPVEESAVSEAILEVLEGANATSFSGDASFALPGCPALDTNRGTVTVPQLPPPPPPPGDADGDGVTNDRDTCPNASGPVNNDGCPLPIRLVDRVVTNATAQPAPVAAVAGIKTASPKLSLGRLTMRGTLARRAVRANGLSPLMVLKPDTKVLRIRIYRRNVDGSRKLVAVRFVSTAAAGSYRARLKDSKLRAALTPGRYEAQVTPGRTRSSLGATSKFAFRITP